MHIYKYMYIYIYICKPIRGLRRRAGSQWCCTAKPGMSGLVCRRETPRLPRPRRSSHSVLGKRMSPID